MLEAAGGDPLRAMEIEERLTPEWWAFWLIYTREKNEALNEMAKAAE